jgi:hypothetical protein
VLTGAGGEFSITNLPSGRYILGVNIHESTRYPDQTPPTFYPGVAARTDAKVIELKPNQIVRNIVLTLQPARAFRIVRVHLRWPNSTIPHRGAVDAWVNKGIYVSNYDLRNGVFELRLLAGVDYWITAAALDETRKPTRFVRGTWVYPEPYRLPSGNEPVDITLTALFAEPQWANAIYPPVITKKK